MNTENTYLYIDLLPIKGWRLQFVRFFASLYSTMTFEEILSLSNQTFLSLFVFFLPLSFPVFHNLPESCRENYDGCWGYRFSLQKSIFGTEESYSAQVTFKNYQIGSYSLNNDERRIFFLRMGKGFTTKSWKVMHYSETRKTLKPRSLKKKQKNLSVAWP